MAQKTLQDMLYRVSEDLDIQDEDFASQREITRLLNAGISEAESTVDRLYEDYFLSSYTLPVTQGVNSYGLPSDIYATKIRSLIFDDGAGNIYEVKRIKNWHKFLKKNVLEYLPTSTQDYRYIVTNTLADGVKLILVPAAYTTLASAFTLWYLRRARQLAALTDTCDIPEFFEFVVQFAKAHLAKKELHPNTQLEWSLLERQRKLMEDTLVNMIPDDDSEIEQDLSHYMEHV